jgi:hypothetical protein
MMSNEVVPFQQMERMAVAVSKSGMFGVKTQEQALSLMLLAQAEGIHVMTAVRDYHIINGRPAMKAEAMLARFQETGGRVEWHELNDTCADASFNGVRISWDLERAKRAGLANKDIWKAYPRAMLRSRVVSEGIRTVMPGVLAGKYTPEETMHIETVEPMVTVEQRLESFGKSLSNDEAEDLIKDISEAPTLEALRDNFGAAWSRAKAIGDESRMVMLKTAYDARKAELETPAPDASDAPEEI